MKKLRVRDIEYPVQVKTAGRWEGPEFSLSISMTLQSAETEAHTARTMIQGWSHWTVLDTEEKEHKCVSGLGTVPQTSVSSRVTGTLPEIWKVCHRWNGQRKYGCSVLEKKRSGGMLAVYEYFSFFFFYRKEIVPFIPLNFWRLIDKMKNIFFSNDRANSNGSELPFIEYFKYT